MHKSKSLLYREEILQRCISDAAVLNFIIGIMTTNRKAGIVHKTLSAFYSCILLQYVSMLTAITDNDLRVILPATLSGLACADIDSRASSQMILGLLSKRITFEPKVFAQIMDACATKVTSGSLEMILLTLFTLCQNQPALNRLPETVIQNLIHVKSLAISINAIMQDFDAESFILPFLNTLFSLVVNESQEAREVFVELLQMPFLSHSLVQKVISESITFLQSKPSEQGITCMQQIQNMHFSTIDTVINDLLKVFYSFNLELAKRGPEKALWTGHQNIWRKCVRGI